MNNHKNEVVTKVAPVIRCTLCTYIRLEESIIEPVSDYRSKLVGCVIVTEKTKRIISRTGRLVCVVCNSVKD